MNIKNYKIDKTIPKMLRLNDDCLFEIFKWFYFEDLLNLTRVCQRFECVIVDMIIRPQFGRHGLQLSSEDNRLKMLNLSDYKQFFKVISRHIHEFLIYDTNGSAFSSYLERYAHRPSLEFYISLNYESLYTLDCMDIKMNDSHMRQLVNSCKQLRVLCIKSKYITGQHIEGFKFLKTLQFFRCNVQKQPLQTIVTQLPLSNFELIDNLTDVTKVLADAQITSITTLEITDPNFGVYFAAKPSLRYLVVYDHPENLVPEKEEPIEEDSEPEEGHPEEAQALEMHLGEGLPVVDALEEEERDPITRLRLYPHLSVWFVKRVKYIEAPRDYDILESLATIVTQLEFPSMNTPNLNALIALVEVCKKLEVLKLELNDYDCDNLEQLTQLCLNGRRDLRVYLLYRKGRKSGAVKKLKMWRANSDLYNSQTNLSLEFIEHSYPRARYLFSFKFM